MQKMLFKLSYVHYALALFAFFRFMHSGICLQLFANRRPLANRKLSQLISQQTFYFINKRVKVSNISTENHRMTVVVCH